MGGSWLAGWLCAWWAALWIARLGRVGVNGANNTMVVHCWRLQLRLREWMADGQWFAWLNDDFLLLPIAWLGLFSC